MEEPFAPEVVSDRFQNTSVSIVGGAGVFEHLLSLSVTARKMFLPHKSF
jgi:hypothetical protein